MAGMVEGRWVDSLPAAEEIQSGRFVRKDSAFRSIISSGKVGNFPAVAGRYHLWVSYGCPWAARALTFRALKGLEEMIPIHYARIGLGNEGWTFVQVLMGRLPQQASRSTVSIAVPSRTILAR